MSARIKTHPCRFNALVNKMTNYERNQWARAGYPGLRKKDVDALMPHAQAAYLRLTGKHMVLATGEVT